MAYTYTARTVRSFDQSYIASNGYYVLGAEHIISSISDANKVMADILKELVEKMNIKPSGVKFVLKGIGGKVYLTIRFTNLEEEIKFVKHANLISIKSIKKIA